MKILNKIYGIILVSKKEDSIRLFNNINYEWNNTIFFQDLYNAIDHLIKEGEQINIVTLSYAFKTLKVYSKDYINRISKLTSDLPSDAFLTINQALSSLKYSQDVKKARVVSEKILKLVESENYTNDSLLDILSDATKNISVKKNGDVNNVDTIFKIIEKHNNVKNGIANGLDLNFKNLERVISLEDVDMCVVGARPAMGKTAFAVEVACRLAKNNKRVALFSLEMSAVQMMRRVVGNLSGIDTNKIKYGECSESELELIYKVQNLEYLNNIKIFEGSHNIRQISQNLNDMKLNKGCDLFIVDYLQKVLPSRSNSSRYEQVTSVSNGIKYISQNMKIPSLCLAQLNRDNAKSGKLPSLPDLRESGEIEQDASIVGFLHRPEYYGEDETSLGYDSKDVCEFLVAKNREGVIDRFEFNVDLKTSQFKEIDRDFKVLDDAPF
mgnify:FL=1